MQLMRLYFSRRLGQRLILLLGFIIVGMFALAGILRGFVEHRDIAEETMLYGQKQAEFLAAMGAGHADRKFLDSLVARAVAQPSVAGATFRDDGGKVLAERESGADDKGEELKFVASLRYSTDQTGQAEINLSSRFQMEKTASAYRRILLQHSLAAGVFFVFLYWSISTSLVAPVNRLLSGLRELRASRATAPGELKGNGGGEIGEIAVIVSQLNRDVFEVREQLQEKVSLANAALLSTVEQLQQRTVELNQRTVELEQALETISRLATTDSLTELPNRRYFEERVEESFARACRFDEPLCMVMFDVDKFKQINDTLGHAAGDVVLRELGGVLKSRARASDVVARLGGDEFALLLLKTSREEAKTFAENLLAKVVAYEFRYGDHVIPVTLSIGVAHFTHTPQKIEALYKAADDALYQAKQRGRNQVATFGAPGD